MGWRWCVFAMVLAGAAFGLTGSAARPLPAPVAAAPARTADPWAAAADLFFKVAARDDAIPDAGVPRAVAQDGEGFLWLGTDAGLARWDGTGFKSYSTQATDGTAALPELMVNLLFADRGGTLWLGMSAEGLLWHDVATDRFRRPPNRTALDRTHITALADDDAGGLWVGSDAGLGHIRGSDHRATLVPGLPPGGIGAVRCDRAHRLWVAVGSRLFRRDPAGRFVPMPLPKVVGTITALHDDAYGRMWVATGESGFHVVAADGSVRHMPVAVDGHAPPLGAMIDAGNGELWTASRAGIWAIDPAAMRIRRIAHDPQQSASPAEDGLTICSATVPGWCGSPATRRWAMSIRRRAACLASSPRCAPRRGGRPISPGR